MVFRLKHILEEIGSGRAIVPVSGYRSLREQSELFHKSWREHGEEYTKKFVARPNHSEHQTGLAIDVAEYSEQIDFICPQFSYEGMAMKFREKAVEYGLIERYPKGKEAITGIAHEPWHFRYVGVPHAQIMTKLGMTLEEYVVYLKQFQDGHQSVLREKEVWQTEGLVYLHESIEYHIYFIKVQGEQTIITLPSQCEFDISGNNDDGFILTIKKVCHTRDTNKFDTLSKNNRRTGLGTIEKEIPMLAEIDPRVGGKHR